MSDEEQIRVLHADILQFLGKHCIMMSYEPKTWAGRQMTTRALQRSALTDQTVSSEVLPRVHGAAHTTWNTAFVRTRYGSWAAAGLATTQIYHTTLQKLNK